MWGYPRCGLGAVGAVLEPFCGHLSPKIDKVSSKLTFEIPPPRALRGSNFGPIAANVHVSAGPQILAGRISLLVPTSAGGSGWQRACRRERRSRKPGGKKGPWSSEACPAKGMRRITSRWQRRQLIPPFASMAWMRTILLAVVLLGPPVQQCSARLGELPPTWHYTDGLSHYSYDAVRMRDGGVEQRAHSGCSSACSSASSRLEGGIDRGSAMMPPWGGRAEGLTWDSGQGVTSRQGLRGGGISQLISSLKNGAGKVWSTEAAAAEVPAEIPAEVVAEARVETGPSERRRGRPKEPLHGRMPEEKGQEADRLAEGQKGAVGRPRRFTVEGAGIVGRRVPVGDGSPPLIPQVRGAP